MALGLLGNVQALLSLYLYLGLRLSTLPYDSRTMFHFCKLLGSGIECLVHHFPSEMYCDIHQQFT